MRKSFDETAEEQRLSAKAWEKENIKRMINFAFSPPFFITDAMKP